MFYCYSQDIHLNKSWIIFHAQGTATVWIPPLGHAPTQMKGLYVHQ